MNTTTNALAVLYRWRLRPGHEDAFVAAWSDATRTLRAQGSLGSRLHHGADGDWYAYAQWPDAATRDAAFAMSVDDDAAARMRATIAKSFPPVLLSTVADQLMPLTDGPA